MASIKCNSAFLTVTFKSEAVAYNFHSDTLRHLQFNSQQKADKNVEKTIHAYDSIFLPCCDISSCGQWFVFCVNKCLFICRTSDWSLIGNVPIHKAPTKIVFSPNGDKIIVADKGGDVHVFLRKSLSSKGSFLLGHLSLLVDVIVTKDERYVISCDRDEKIRVSHYPDAYNIKSYCLGHEEFVTCIKLLPYSENILISASGDASIRFWDFENGRELLVYQCSNDVNETSFVHDDDSNNDHATVFKFETFVINDSESGICVLFDHYKGFVTYSVKGTYNKLTCKKLQSFNHDSVVHDFCLHNDLLWLLSNDIKSELHAFKWNGDLRCFKAITSNEKVKNTISCVNKFLSNMDVNMRSSFSVLYKKQFDTVQEYYKRKSDVLCESKKKNKIVQ